MLKDEIEQTFVNAILRSGVTHKELEAILTAPNSANLISQLRPYVKLCVKRAERVRIAH